MLQQFLFQLHVYFGGLYLIKYQLHGVLALLNIVPAHCLFGFLLFWLADEAGVNFIVCVGFQPVLVLVSSTFILNQRIQRNMILRSRLLIYNLNRLRDRYHIRWTIFVIVIKSGVWRAYDLLGLVENIPLLDMFTLAKILPLR